jgi:light-regulated signal transduction histidine kinase (bacteriophytochrome)
MNAGTKNAAVMPADAGASQPSAIKEVGILLTYGSLHDLAGPANQVCSLAELLRKQYGDRIGPDAQAVFDLLQGSVTRLQNLLAGVRTYAQIVGRQSSFARADVNALLAASICSLRGLIDETGAQVTSDHLPEVYGDSAQISYMFTALLENAIKFHGEAHPTVHVAAKPSDGMWVLSVQDNGIGIDPKNQTRIFELFRRAHNEKYPGAGVGLAVADRIVQRHGGKIWVESAIGRGSIFYFSLPGHPPADAVS